MRCSWCGGEILPEMTYTYGAMKNPLPLTRAAHLADDLAGREFCSGRCLQNYIRAILPDERRTEKAG